MHGIWELSVQWSQFFCKSKIFLKNKNYFKITPKRMPIRMTVNLARIAISDRRLNICKGIKQKINILRNI